MIYKIFAEALLKNPNGTAIVTNKGVRLSYLEVEEKVLKWANFLQKSAIKPNQIIAVFTKNEDLHVFIFLALNRIGATYLPFDLDTPLARIKYGLESLSCTKIIIDEDLLNNLDPTICIPLNSGTLAEIHALSPIPIQNEYPNVSYILSSSGFTGTPKWIPIQGDGLIYWAKVERELLGLNSDDRILCTRSPAYDARISEYVRAFAGCGSLYLMSATERKDMDAILEYCQKYKITCLILIASQLNLENTALFLSELKNYGLKHLMVTGEACSPLLVKGCEQNEINLWNCYGPTEATFGMSILKVNGLLIEENNRTIVPIAPPQFPVKEHEIDGQLYIQSPFLSEGYLGDSQGLNDLDFPIIEIEGQPVRVFKTGDKFSKLPNNLLSFEGRAGDDSHAKVNGVKIFPFMIEQSIKAYSLTAFKVIVVIKKWLGQDKPFAYLELNHEIDKSNFSNYLKTNLKNEEIPIFIALPSLPILPQSQKIDRQSLMQRIDSADDNFFNEKDIFTEKVDEKRAYYYKVLTEIWCDLLNLSSVSIKQDFIFSGGDSFLANKLSQKIKQKLAGNFRYFELLKLKTNTIYELTEYLLKRNLDNSLNNEALINCLFIHGPYNPNLFMLPPILGEGYYTYRHLAAQLGKQLKCNVYGLSDPSIFDENHLPKSLEEATLRYLKKIKEIQPIGPYEILGYSFGATLAEEVAKKLEEQGEKISKLHLLDGFPPLLYQKLDNAGHALLLEQLINFMLDILNNNHYDQSLIPRKYKDLNNYSPLQQIEKSLNHLLSEINMEKPHADDAKRLILLAQRHLTLMHSVAVPETKSGLLPILYLTNKTQPYLVTIETIKSLSRLSTDHSYFYWNYYFKSMRKSAAHIEAKHHEILSENISLEVKQYFRLSHDFMFNVNSAPSHFSPGYVWEGDKIHLFFLSDRCLFYKTLVEKLHLLPESFQINKNSYTHNKHQNDSFYVDLEYHVVKVPKEKRKFLESFLQYIKLREIKYTDVAFKPEFSPGSIPVIVHLNVRWGTNFYYSLDFNISIESLPEIEADVNCFKVKNKNIFHYSYLIDDQEMETLEKAKGWVCKALTSLSPCLDSKSNKPQFVQNENCFFSTKNSKLSENNIVYSVEGIANLL